MVAEAELDRLAELVGIEPFYWDIWGNRIEIAAETKRDLIAAMGLSASGAAEVAASLRAVEEQAWRRMLAPVTVLDAGAPGSLTFTVPDRPPETEAVWTFWEENGATRSGRIRLADLVREADHELEGTRFARYRLPLPEDLPEGYHRLTLDLPETGGDLP